MSNLHATRHMNPRSSRLTSVNLSELLIKVGLAHSTCACISDLCKDATCWLDNFLVGAHISSRTL